ncbi:hypothetical protein FB451DRAFT_195186 [Mycena latifolia]|nr:hypothetical protein FB451DRAFT_195186 [Mycena latifolia]
MVAPARHVTRHRVSANLRLTLRRRLTTRRGFHGRTTHRHPAPRPRSLRRRVPDVRCRCPRRRALPPAPAKSFQCRGFGECRMVFSRSGYLARHTR